MEGGGREGGQEGVEGRKETREQRGDGGWWWGGGSIKNRKVGERSWCEAEASLSDSVYLLLISSSQGFIPPRL